MSLGRCQADYRRTKGLNKTVKVGPGGQGELFSEEEHKYMDWLHWNWKNKITVYLINKGQMY